MSCECTLEDESKINARIAFQNVLKIVYGRGLLDRIALETQLDELSWYFDVSLMPGDLQIKRSPTKYDLIDPFEYNKIFEGINE